MDPAEYTDIQYNTFKQAIMAILGMSKESACTVADIEAICYQALEWEYTLTNLHEMFEAEE